MRLKALTLDFLLCAVVLVAIDAPGAALLAALLATDAAGFVVPVFILVVVVHVAATVLFARRFDLPFPPWAPRRADRASPGKTRFPYDAAKT